MQDNSSKEISTFYKKHRRMPTYSEMMELFGYKSKNAVFKLINKLVESGAIKKDKLGHLSPGNLFGEIKVLGVVEAGFPTTVEAETTDTLNLDEWLVADSDATYLLKVKGDSMIEAGIIEGDMVLADRSKQAKDGNIVIAYVDGGWTMKYLKKNGGRVELIPANKKYRPIVPKHDLQIAAVVTSVIRKY